MKSLSILICFAALAFSNQLNAADIENVAKDEILPIVEKDVFFVQNVAQIIVQDILILERLEFELLRRGHTIDSYAAKTDIKILKEVYNLISSQQIYFEGYKDYLRYILNYTNSEILRFRNILRFKAVSVSNNGEENLPIVKKDVVFVQNSAKIIVHDIKVLEKLQLELFRKGFTIDSGAAKTDIEILKKVLNLINSGDIYFEGYKNYIVYILSYTDGEILRFKNLLQYNVRPISNNDEENLPIVEKDVVFVRNAAKIIIHDIKILERLEKELFRRGFSIDSIAAKTDIEILKEVLNLINSGDIYFEGYKTYVNKILNYATNEISRFNKILN